MARGPSVRRLAAQDLTSALGVGRGDLAAVVGAAGKMTLMRLRGTFTPIHAAVR